MNARSLQERIHLEMNRGSESLTAAQLTFDEGVYSETISSAYYAMFHYARAALLTVSQDPTTHQGVLSLFGLHLVKTGKVEEGFHRLLIESKEAREDSDYDPAVKFTEEEARTRLENAKRFISRIKTFLGTN